MKTHRIILPVPQHEAALRGVDRLLLPLDRAAKARLSEAGGPVIEANNYYTGAPERGLAWYWKERGCWNSTDPFFPPYKRGDRLALLEPTSEVLDDSQCDSTRIVYQDQVNPDEFEWTPPSRMPLRACRCFYRVLAVEPALQPKLSDQNASGVVGAWAWSVKVEKESK